MTGLDVARHVIVEIAVLVTDGDLEPLDDGIDLDRAPAARRARRDGRLRAQDAHEVGAARRDRGVDAVARRRRRAGARLRRGARARRRRPRRCAATRSASTAGSSTASSPSSTATCTTAASTCRASRSCAGAGTPTVYKKRPGKAETHRALADVRESIDELRYYREHMLRAAGRPTSVRRRSRVRPSELAEGAEERRHRALARRVAHEADAPGLARRTRRARRRPRCRRCSSSALRSVASSAPSGSQAVVSSGRRWPSGTTRRNPSSGSARLQARRRPRGGGPTRPRGPRRGARRARRAARRPSRSARCGGTRARRRRRSWRSATGRGTTTAAGAARCWSRSTARVENVTGDSPGGTPRHFCVPE